MRPKHPIAATWAPPICTRGVHFTSFYACKQCQSWLGRYCVQVLHANLASLSGTKTLPYLVMFLTSNLGGWTGDHLISQRVTSTAGGRKAVNTIGAPLAIS